jgi:hypothetical protein
MSSLGSSHLWARRRSPWAKRSHSPRLSLTYPASKGDKSYSQVFILSKQKNEVCVNWAELTMQSAGFGRWRGGRALVVLGSSSVLGCNRKEAVPFQPCPHQCPAAMELRWLWAGYSSKCFPVKPTHLRRDLWYKNFSTEESGRRPDLFLPLL